MQFPESAEPRRSRANMKHDIVLHFILSRCFRYNVYLCIEREEAPQRSGSLGTNQTHLLSLITRRESDDGLSGKVNMSSRL